MAAVVLLHSPSVGSNATFITAERHGSASMFSISVIMLDDTHYCVRCLVVIVIDECDLCVIVGKLSNV